MVKGVLLDIAGVLHLGQAPQPGAAEAVAALREAELPLCFLTNSTRSPRRAVLDKLHTAGIDAAPQEVLTPVTAAHEWLQAHGHRPHLLVHPDLEEDFANIPDTGPPAVIIGDAAQHFTYERLNAAFRAIDGGAPFLALAANRVFRDADGQLSLDAGAFVRALEYSSGVAPEILGKPAEAFFHTGVHALDCAPDDVAMIGDDAENDIAGALRAGIGMGILVRTGKYRPGDEARFDPGPSFVADDISGAVRIILQNLSPRTTP